MGSPSRPGLERRASVAAPARRGARSSGCADGGQTHAPTPLPQPTPIAMAAPRRVATPADCSLPAWLSAFEGSTFDTRLVRLPPDVAAYLAADGVFLAADSRAVRNGRGVGRNGGWSGTVASACDRPN